MKRRVLRTRPCCVCGFRAGFMKRLRDGRDVHYACVGEVEDWGRIPGTDDFAVIVRTPTARVAFTGPRIAAEDRLTLPRLDIRTAEQLCAEHLRRVKADDARMWGASLPIERPIGHRYEP